MTSHDKKPADLPEHLLETPQLADALESDRFRRFLDHIPFAVVVAELQPAESITYANVEFERLTGKSPENIQGKSWEMLAYCVSTTPGGPPLSQAILNEDHLGTFRIEGDNARVFDAWSNIIHDDNGVPAFRLAALVDVSSHQGEGAIEERLREKDTLLRELQHRVKNNLQMITALIRMEARNVPDNATGDKFDRLAGRIGALSILYTALSSPDGEESIDLGIYLSQIASAVMQAHAVEGIRLDLKVDTWPVSINVAMPTGLVVNELLTNSLKHAFAGRDGGGTITLHSLVDDTGCRVTIADDGIGLAEGVTWPQAGKLGMLIVDSLRSNAKARIDVKSEPNKGARVTIFFAREAAAPEAT